MFASITFVLCFGALKLGYLIIRQMINEFLIIFFRSIFILSLDFFLQDSNRFFLNKNNKKSSLNHGQIKVYVVTTKHSFILKRSDMYIVQVHPKNTNPLFLEITSLN